MGWLITRLAQATSVYTDDVWVADSSRSSALGPARQCTAPIWQDTPSTATAPPTPVTSGDAGCSWWPHSTACPWGRADPPRCERKGAVEITRTPTCKVGKWPLHCGLCKRSLAGTCSSKVQQQWRNPAMVDATIRGWPGVNDAQRAPRRHFASKGLGVRVPLAPPISPCQAYFQHSLAIRTQSTCSNKLQQLAVSSDR